MTSLWLLLMALLASVACGAPPIATGTVETLSTRIEVGTDGNLDVHDAFIIAPDDSRRIAFHRVVHSLYADRITFVGASVDDRPIEPGADGLAVEHRAGRVNVRWQPDARLSHPVRLTLSYRVTAAVAVREPRGRIEWPVLTSDRGFAIGAANIALELPDGVRTYDGTGMAEAGWSVALTPRGVTARRETVADDESATLLAVFDVDRAFVAQPQWEWDQDRQQQFLPALVAASLFILIIGAGVLVQMRVQYPPAPAGASDDTRRAVRANRQMLARGLWMAGWIGVAFAAMCAAIAHAWLSGLGLAVQAIPGSMAIVSVAFLLASVWYSARRFGSRPLPKGDEG